MLVLGWRVCLLSRVCGARALLCAASIGRACESNLYTPAQMTYFRASADSRDARDVVFHRAVLKTCAGLKVDGRAAASIENTRLANNALIHALEIGDGDALDVAMQTHVNARRLKRK